MILFRSAVKQIAHRHGYHATFMCRPKLPNAFASGWHLHQSIVSRGSGENAFMTKDNGEVLSPFGRQYLAGLLEHARASTVFHHAHHQRLQALPFLFAGAGSCDLGPRQPRRDGARARRSRRCRDAAGKPHRRARRQSLSLHASQILSGLDGVDRALDPGPSADTPYETQAALLPKTLREAVFALKDDPFFRDALGAGFVDYYVHIKKRRNRALPGRSVGLGTARIFRDVLRA